MKIEPKFYKNWKDDNHCLQAAVMMVLNTLDGPVKWEEVNKATRYENGLYTWTIAGVLALAERISGIIFYSTMDYQQFAERGEEYLREYWENSPEWFKLQEQHASLGFSKEQSIAKELILRRLFEKRRLTKYELEVLLANHLLIVLADSGLLSGGETEGHFILLYDQKGGEFLIHDPGLPPRPAWAVDKDQFMEAFRDDVIVVPKAKLLP